MSTCAGREVKKAAEAYVALVENPFHESQNDSHTEMARMRILSQQACASGFWPADGDEIFQSLIIFYCGYSESSFVQQGNEIGLAKC